MSSRKIQLTVSITAMVVGGDDYIPESTASTEEVTIALPNMDNKFVVFPKIIEGATLGVIRNLQSNVGVYLDKKRAEEKKRREIEQLRLQYPGYMPEDDGEPFEDDAEGETGGDLDQDQVDEESVDVDEQPNRPFIDFERVAQEAEAAKGL